MVPSDILIVGGGFTGLSLAAALDDGRREIVVLEARNGPDPHFRGELIHPPGARELDRLGFLTSMREKSGLDVRGFAVVPEASHTAVELPYEPAPTGQGPGYAMDHQEMVDVMRSVVARRNRISLRMGERATEVLKENGRVVGVRTAAGKEYRANLTLVAEGRLSKMRGLLGLEGEMTLMSYSAALFAEGAELPHPGYGHVVIGAPGPLLAYPIGTGVRFCVDLPLDTGKGKAAIEKRLREEYAPVLSPMLRDAMLRAMDRKTLQVCATQQLHTTRCVLPGVALIGDAAGCSHPITAAGMTTCLRDVRTLVTALDRFGERDGQYDALKTYERERYRQARAIEILTERLYEVFLGRDDGMRTLRDGMLEYWKDTARARIASMGLLSGQSTSIPAFAREFTTVFSYATRAALRTRGTSNSRPLRDRVRVVGEMTSATMATLRRATKAAFAEAMR